MGSAGRVLCGSQCAERVCKPPAAQLQVHTQPALAPRPPAPPAAAGATTKAGTWAPTEDDAKFIEMMADMEDKWQQVRTA